MARVLGIDPGTVRCGIAISDSSQKMAFPRPALRRDTSMLVRLGALIEEESIATVVVGRPVALSGNETASTRDADDLFAELHDSFDVAIVQWDERLTTIDAQKSLSEAGLSAKESRERIDSAAAVIMLQNYLDGLNAE